MKSEKTIIRELRSLMGLMRLGILLAAMALTAGCSGGSGDDSDSLTPNPGTPGPDEFSTPIVFSAQQDEGQGVTRAAQSAQGVTRASTPLNDIVQSFKVWGYKNMSDATLQTVFPGYTVNYVSAAHSTATNSNGWEYVRLTPTEQTIKYWDWSVSAYRFFAVAETPTGPEKANVSGASGGVVVLTVDAADEAATPYYSRLWYSTGVLPEFSSRQFGQPVQLEFLKPLSRVRFMYQFVSPREGLTMGEQTFKPTDDDDIETAGTVTVTYPLTGVQTQETLTVSSSSAIDALTEDYNPDTEEGWYTVLPATGQGSYTLTVNVNGEDKPAVVPAAYMDWLPGYCYTYVFKIDATGGVEIGWVGYAATPWDTTLTPTDWSVYNW